MGRWASKSQAKEKQRRKRQQRAKRPKARRLLRELPLLVVVVRRGQERKKAEQPRKGPTTANAVGDAVQVVTIVVVAERDHQVVPLVHLTTMTKCSVESRLLQPRLL